MLDHHTSHQHVKSCKHDGKRKRNGAVVVYSSRSLMSVQKFSHRNRKLHQSRCFGSGLVFDCRSVDQRVED